ncbi:MAG: hypothetical protein JXR63_07460 [Spirochaetales bacterium]|nr:hypothetical protein [Spirochaetales bacterium]
MKRFIPSALFLVILFVFGCSATPDTLSIDNAVPASDTQIFQGNSRGIQVADAGEFDTVVLSGSVSEFAVGSHIILDDDAVAGGRLYKIESATDNGNGTVTLKCSNGLLEDALQSASVSQSYGLTNNDIVEIVPLDGVTNSRAISWSGDYSIDLGSLNVVTKIEDLIKDEAYKDSPIHVSDVLKLTIGGQMKIKPAINLDLQIEKFKTQRAVIDLGADIQTNMIIEGGVEFRGSHTIPLFNINYGVITIMAGPVPIILQPIFRVDLTVGYGVEATASVVFSQFTSIRVGGQKLSADAEWEDFSHAKFSKPEFHSANADINFNASVTLTETAGILFYGVVGVQINVSQFARFNAVVASSSNPINLDPELSVADRWEQMYVGSYQFQFGVSANVGLMVSAFGFINQTFNVWGDEWVLCQWNLNKDTGYEKDPETGMYGKWTYPAIQHLIDK